MGIGGVNPRPGARKKIHVSATVCGDTTTLRYSMRDARDHKKPRTQPPLTGVGCEPAPESQPKKSNRVCNPGSHLRTQMY